MQQPIQILEKFHLSLNVEKLGQQQKLSNKK